MNRLILGDRRTGKTLRILKLAETTGKPIIVSSRDMKKVTERFAKQLGFNVKVYSVKEFQDCHMKYEFRNGVLIDELGLILQSIFGEIYTATFGSHLTEVETMKYDELEDEINRAEVRKLIEQEESKLKASKLNVNVSLNDLDVFKEFVSLLTNLLSEDDLPKEIYDKYEYEIAKLLGKGEVK